MNNNDISEVVGNSICPICHVSFDFVNITANYYHYACSCNMFHCELLNRIIILEFGRSINKYDFIRVGGFIATNHHKSYYKDQKNTIYYDFDMPNSEQDLEKLYDNVQKLIIFQ